MKRLIQTILGIFSLWLAANGHLFAQESSEAAFVRVSSVDSHYFELSDGSPFIPIGLNLSAMGNLDTEQGLGRMEGWLTSLSNHGGNFARVWLSSPFWDVEHEASGRYDPEKAKRIDALLKMARRHGIRLKLTLEHFREIDPESGYSKGWALKSLHHVSRGGTATSMTDWFEGEESRKRFEKKLDWFSNRYGNDPYVFGWELWNEVNAARSGSYLDWTEHMLLELDRRFPKNLVMQSLGSFDRPGNRQTYEEMVTLEGNEVAQVHRYLDLGAELEICHGPVDLLCAEAIRELIAMEPDRPILLAESGAVQPRHTGPFELYSKDTEGMILHDVLFAPFFAGAAGTGQIWHWEHYVNRNDLWRHFDRFAEAVAKIAPAEEAFRPTMLAHSRLRVYVLNGKETALLWCRDSQNTWKTELDEGIPPERLDDVTIDISSLEVPEIISIRGYDPWEDRWSEIPYDHGELRLPSFRRSYVLRIEQ
jgi:hypothetical protein